MFPPCRTGRSRPCLWHSKHRSSPLPGIFVQRTWRGTQGRSKRVATRGNRQLVAATQVRALTLQVPSPVTWWLHSFGWCTTCSAAARSKNQCLNIGSLTSFVRRRPLVLSRMDPQVSGGPRYFLITSEKCAAARGIRYLRLRLEQYVHNRQRRYVFPQRCVRSCVHAPLAESCNKEMSLGSQNSRRKTPRPELRRQTSLLALARLARWPRFCIPRSSAA